LGKKFSIVEFVKSWFKYAPSKEFLIFISFDLKFIISDHAAMRSVGHRNTHYSSGFTTELDSHWPYHFLESKEGKRENTSAILSITFLIT